MPTATTTKDEDEDEDGKPPKPPKRRDAFFYLGEQGADGMSEGKFCVDPELRAYLEALFSKAAKPGVNNPADPTSIIHDETGGKDSTSPAAASDGARPDPAAAEPDSPTSGGVCDTDTPPPPEPDDRSTSDQGLWSDAGLWNDGSFDGDDPCDGDGRCGDGLDCGCGTGPDGTIEPEGTAEPDDTVDADTDGDEALGKAAARDAAAARDTRTQRERQHDALKLALRHTLASGTLGTHRGLPVTAIVTMTLKDLEAGCGYAMTATGSRVSIRDAIRMASHAHHYLTIFDDHGRALYLGRSKRIASADQRIVLIARDRGCSFPSCTRPATWCQAHHVTDWNTGGYTDIDSLTFGCDMHHALVGTGPGKWATTKTGAGHRYPGRTLWHPPAGMDPKRRGLINHAHHPEEVLYPPDNHGDPGDEEPRQPA
ncbi:HNH endonuclease signature motif containing protein [Rhodococcus sp. 05-2255-2A2]|uniref:HNH endonuclease signature motif containing protein n=1 Tax=Rhodococcus sp. 05-2255-2A2 TaxID=2022488 RepID=UPI00359C63EE